jgi:hypothetical protein
MPESKKNIAGHEMPCNKCRETIFIAQEFHYDTKGNVICTECKAQEAK